MFEININLEGLLYNNDKYAIEYIKTNLKDINVKEYEKPVKKSIVNKIKLMIKEDYSIDYLLKKLSYKLFEKIEEKNIDKKKEKQTYNCFYCFSDRDLNNENDLNEIIKIEKNIKIDKIEKKEDIDEIDIDEELSEIELTDVELDEITDMEGGSNKNNKNNKNHIFICKNCKKIYFMSKYFNYRDYMNYDKYNDIFPFPELLYLRNDDKKISFNLIDIQKKEIEYKYNKKDIISPYNEIENINKKFLVDDKKNKLYTYLYNYSLNNGKEYKYIINTSYMLINNYNYNNLTLTYFPELCLYKKNNEYKLIDLYSKLYYPNVNFENYYLKFINQIDKNEYIKGLLQQFEIEKREINDDYKMYTVEQIMSKKYGEEEMYEGWGIEIENKEKIDKYFEKIDETKIKSKIFTSKIFYKINDNNQNTSLINFNLLYHLFELDEEIPFLTSYLPEEGVMLEKYYKPLQKNIEELNLKIKNKKILRFLIKIPNTLIKKTHYFYVNLYENLKIEVTITIPYEIKKYINQKDLLIINDKVNNLIKKLNSLNIFTFLDLEKIPLSNETFEEWNKDNTIINTLNINMLIKEKKIENIEKKIFDISKCLKNYFIKDYSEDSDNYRYIKINNINLGVLTDRYIYFKIQNIKQLDLSKTDEEIEEIVIKSLMVDFQKNYTECKNIYKNYLNRYKNIIDTKIIPINYGVFFNVKNNEENNNEYIINIYGLRNYDNIKKIEGFLKKIFYMLLNPYDENIKKIRNICELMLKENNEFEKKLRNSNLLLLNKKYRTCFVKIDEIKNNNNYKKNKKENDKVINKFKDIQKKIKKEIIETEKITKYVKTLKRLQDYYPNLKYKCSTDKNIKQYTKRCQGGKQPMGTGDGIYEEVIDFNEEYEKKRLNKLDDITCSLDDIKSQKGGSNNNEKNIDIIGKYTYLSYCNYFSKNEKYKNFSQCYIEITTGQATGKKIIQKIAKDIYNIDNENIKIIKKILNMINNKIINSKVTINNYNIYLKKLKEFSKNEFLIEFYSSRLHRKSLNNNDNLKELSNLILNKIVNKQLLFDTIIDSLNNKKNIENLLKYLNFEDRLQELIKKQEFDRKAFLIYLINYIFEDVNITNEQYKKIFNYIKKKYIEKDNLKIIYDIFIQAFLEKNLMDIKIIYKKVKEEEKQIDETSLNELKKEIPDLLIKLDKNNHIRDSVLNYKGKSLTCPNYSNDNKPPKPLIGFLDISKFSNKNNLNDNEIRDLVCQPCCFVQKYDNKNNDHIISKRYRKNMLFCKNKISWNEYINLTENESRIEGYIYSESLNIKSTYGMLPKLLYSLFNNQINLVNIRFNKNYENIYFSKFNQTNRVLKNYGYVLKGYEQKKDVILLILEDLLKINRNEIINKIEEKLKNDKIIFNILNNGKLKLFFKTIENYINYLKNGNINIEWIIDILNEPNIFLNYKDGFNIIIFEKEKENEDDSDIKILSYENINMIDYYNPNKNHIFLYKYQTEEIEPILLKNNDEYYGIFHKDYIYNLDLKKIEEKYNIDMKFCMNIFINTINEWIKYNFKNNYITSTQIVKIMKNEIKLQYYDIFYNVNYVVTNDNILIPVLHSKINKEVKYSIFNDENDLNKYLRDINETIDNMLIISKKLKNEDYQVDSIILNNDNYIIGLELRNKLIIPCKKEIYNNKKKYNNINRISQKTLYFKINNILYENKEIPNDIEFMKEKFDIEIYERFIIEISNYLKNNEDKKILLINNIIENKKNEILLLIEDIFNEICILKEEDLINYNKKNNNISNIRVLCDNNNNKYCEDNKLIVPVYKKNLLIGLFIENLINNEIFRNKILTNNINYIIDVNKFIDTNNNIYLKKEVDF